MRTKLYQKFVMLVLIFIPLLSFTQPQPVLPSSNTNSKYYDKDGRFKVYFPGTPSASYQDVETDLGTVRMYQFTYESETSVYMIAYVDYPADRLVGMDVNEMLNNAKTGFINNLGLTISNEGSLTLNNNQGIWFDGEGSDGSSAAMRDYLVNNRLYQVGILSSGSINSDLKRRFLDSFELLDY